jgi:hypothetical protein
MSSGKNKKKSAQKLCKGSCSIRNHRDSAPSRRNHAKAAAFGGGNLRAPSMGVD